jgi:hypothetical protein
VLQNSDDRPLHELLDLLQSKVGAAPVLLGAGAEREAIEAIKPMLAWSQAETFKAFRRKASSLR